MVRAIAKGFKVPLIRKTSITTWTEFYIIITKFNLREDAFRDTRNEGKVLRLKVKTIIVKYAANIDGYYYIPKSNLGLEI